VEDRVESHQGLCLLPCSTILSPALIAAFACLANTTHPGPRQRPLRTIPHSIEETTGRPNILPETSPALLQFVSANAVSTPRGALGLTRRQCRRLTTLHTTDGVHILN